MKIKQLTWQQGLIEKSLHDILHLPFDPIPDIVWVEPQPFLMETTRLDAPIEFWGLHVLQKDTSNWPQKILAADDIIPQEACLYWDNRFCHLLETSDDRCRWFYCSENQAKFEKLNPEFIPTKTDNIDVKKEQDSRSVITRQDTHRFAFKPADLDKSQRFKVVTYWNNSALFAWRLLKG
jgi:hypothetical protein